MDFNEEIIKKDYEIQNHEITAKTGRILAFIAVPLCIYFLLQDFLVLHLNNLFIWRIIGFFPVMLYSIFSFTWYKNKSSNIMFLHMASMASIMIMAVGINITVYLMPQASLFQKFRVVNALIVCIFGVFIFADGARRFLIYTLLIPMAALLICLAVNKNSIKEMTDFINPFVVCICVMFISFFQEKLSYNEFKLRKVNFLREKELEEKNRETTMLNESLSCALNELEKEMNERILSEEKVKQEHKVLEAFLNAVTEAAFLIDINGTIIFANNTLTERFKKDINEIAWKSIDEIYPYEKEKNIREIIKGIIETKKSVGYEKIENGRVIEYEYYPVFNMKGEVDCFAVLGKDVTDQKNYERQLAYLASSDTLTGLPNRRHFKDYLVKMISDSNSKKTSVLLYIDLDNFKIVNDTLGHGAGDAVLMKVAELFKTCLRKEDIAFRIGGDEFVIVLSDTYYEQAVIAAERIKKTINDHDFILCNTVYKIGLSIGMIAVDGTMNFDMLLSKVDKTMYKAKKRGRNRVELYKV